MGTGCPKKVSEIRSVDYFIELNFILNVPVRVNRYVKGLGSAGFVFTLDFAYAYSNGLLVYLISVAFMTV